MPVSKRKSNHKSVDALVLLRDDHRAAKKLFSEFSRAGSGARKTKRKLVDRMIHELSLHSAIEETVFYPWVRDHVEGLDDEILESLEEHHVAKLLLRELEGMDPADERFDAKTTVLIDMTRHHIDEEEKLFAAVRDATTRTETREIGAVLESAKAAGPTRPHPSLPDEPPANLVTGPLSAVADRAWHAGKDAVERLS